MSESGSGTKACCSTGRWLFPSLSLERHNMQSCTTCTNTSAKARKKHKKRGGEEREEREEPRSAAAGSAAGEEAEGDATDEMRWYAEKQYNCNLHWRPTKCRWGSKRAGRNQSWYSKYWHAQNLGSVEAMDKFYEEYGRWPGDHQDHAWGP